MYIVYGIPNCDSVKKATDWLHAKGIVFNFYNFKTHGISEQLCKEWIQQKGLEIIVNKRSTTFKDLSVDHKAALANEITAIAIIQQYTSLVKRPIITKDEAIVAVGFKENEYEQLFK